MSLKLTIQQCFARLGDWIYCHPKKVLISTLVIAALCCASLGSLRIDTSNESNLDKTHPDVLAYHEFHKRYGFEEALVVMIKTPEIFDVTFLKKLMAFHAEIETNTYNFDRIKSLASVDVIYGEDDDLIVDNLELTFPETPEALETFKQRVM
ncbi:MAG: hypothetical protein OXE99_02670 [Cellvibrionales bacterium]|nr:hypothetical protein [Cellvibrionales bacterium]